MGHHCVVFLGENLYFLSASLHPGVYCEGGVIILLGPVVRRPISANPGLNFNLRFFIPLLKSLFGKIFSVLFKASSSHTLNKKNSTEFSCKAFRSEIGFHTNPGLS